jgi:hypothetical protein
VSRPLAARPCLGVSACFRSNFWALGADGVYLYNWYGLPADATEKLALLDQVGDVKTLRNVNKRFQPKFSS